VKVTSLFMILFTVSQFFLSSWRLWYWYAYPAVLFCVFVLPLFLQKLLALVKVSERALHTAGFILLAVTLISAAFWGWNYGGDNTNDFRVRNMHIAEELNTTMTDSTLIAMGDRAGSFAYFFRGGVVQAEGLAGNAELVNAIKQERLQEYLEEAGVEYILSWTGPGNSVDYTSWDLLVPDRAQSMSLQNRITVYQSDEAGRWPGSNGTVGTGFVSDDFVLVHRIASDGYFTSWGGENGSAFFRLATTLSYLTDFGIWGSNPAGFHITNVLWHLFAGIAVFLLLLSLFRQNRFPQPCLFALLSSVLFLSLASHSESVAWVSGRTDVMATVFSMLSILIFYRHQTKPSVTNAVFAVVLLSLGLLAKESVIVTPLLWGALFVYSSSLKKKITAEANGFLQFRWQQQEFTLPLVLFQIVTSFQT